MQDRSHDRQTPLSSFLCVIHPVIFNTRFGSLFRLPHERPGPISTWLFLIGATCGWRGTVCWEEERGGESEREGAILPPRPALSTSTRTCITSRCKISYCLVRCSRDARCNYWMKGKHVSLICLVSCFEQIHEVENLHPITDRKVLRARPCSVLPVCISQYYTGTRACMRVTMDTDQVEAVTAVAGHFYFLTMSCCIAMVS